MTKVVTEIDDLTFGWYSKWIKLDECGHPKTRSLMARANLQPSRSSGLLAIDKRCPEVSSQTRDCLVLSMRWPTPLDFEMKLLMHWEKDHTSDESYINKKIDLLYWCLQGVAATKCDLCAVNYKGKNTKRRTSWSWDARRIFLRLLPTAPISAIEWFVGCASRPSLVTCYLKNFSITAPRSWTTSKWATFIATRNFQAMLSYATKFSLLK